MDIDVIGPGDIITTLCLLTSLVFANLGLLRSCSSIHGICCRLQQATLQFSFGPKLDSKPVGAFCRYGSAARSFLSQAAAQIWNISYQKRHPCDIVTFLANSFLIFALSVLHDHAAPKYEYYLPPPVHPRNGQISLS
ncbi:hypothetical protein F5890DRAFT_935177 [Lentinula detonsa]|uniref:Uncharacterized protein n=1 Tax=Lentinula detonsa TaxID=2804962 RepID=A0AA38Q555_9AGAR|nr:hypothetical protein F5890DRAFT_935177 [Lentinula detonsa]